MDRKIEQFGISKRELFNRLFNVETLITKDGNVYKFEGLPDDATLVDIYWDFGTQTMKFLLESEKFPTTPEGGQIRNNYTMFTEYQTKKTVVEYGS